MASILNELQIKYKGTNVTKTGNEERTVVIYQGRRELCERALNDRSLVQNDELGYIDSMRLYQDEGPHWNLEVTYVIEYTNASLIVGGAAGQGGNQQPQTPQRQKIKKGSSKNASASELSVRMFDVPIENLSNYRCNWNRSLFCTWSQYYLETYGRIADEDVNPAYPAFMNVYIVKYWKIPEGRKYVDLATEELKAIRNSALENLERHE